MTMNQKGHPSQVERVTRLLGKCCRNTLCEIGSQDPVTNRSRLNTRKAKSGNLNLSLRILLSYIGKMQGKQRNKGILHRKRFRLPDLALEDRCRKIGSQDFGYYICVSLHSFSMSNRSGTKSQNTLSDPVAIIVRDPVVCRRTDANSGLKFSPKLSGHHSLFGPAPLQKCVGDFVVSILENLPGIFIFLATFSKNGENKSGDKIREKKSGGPKLETRDKSVLPKTDPNTFLRSPALSANFFGRLFMDFFCNENAKFTQSLLCSLFAKFTSGCNHSHVHSLFTAYGSSECSSIHVSIGDYQYRHRPLKTNRQTDLRKRVE